MFTSFCRNKPEHIRTACVSKASSATLQVIAVFHTIKPYDAEAVRDVYDYWTLEPSLHADGSFMEENTVPSF